ncbi:hypothetical protein AJ80_00340 [Polytolypa hystricis UAMH7299]|uniref:Anaphase-promoting complex subunit 4 WD40 domain-containing protein n=1 Tax=Polytolypa hystricis (strain UAMH7299) TaxID=1447883 RepID=A0A2B7Z4B9_POLH7|nr:hypothetical protein AJ80_00340 [Polytolypa hystricis UAMH7299]
MDVHRCRFVPYNPQAINALAFSHPPSVDISGRGVPTLRLAIGRANGDIEIWNPLRGVWFQESILRGGKDRSIEGLAWTLDPSEVDGEGIKLPGKLRLFSIGYSSVVTEWDLEKGLPARHSSGNFGEIWCLAAQPRWKPTQKDEDGKPLSPAEGEYTGQHLAAGCADGSIVILSTEDGDLKYLRTVRPSTRKARVLSLAFQDRNTVVAGYADSSIRVFDIRSGKLIRTMSLGKGPAKGTKELLVWSVKCLPAGGIVSGDSAGEIRFWDAKNYSLIQRLQGHQADVLDIAVSADGETVISGGADQRTAIYKMKGGKKDKSRRWAEATHRRYHTHDVKAFAVYETKNISIVVSGGLDTTPVVVPLREYGKENHRKLPSLPQCPQLSSSPASRLLMGWWEREVNFWQVPKRFSTNDDDILDGQSHRLVGKVLIQGEENISSAAMSLDGKLLVAATTSQVKMFGLKRRKGEDKSVLRVNKIELPSEVSNYGAKVVSISPDSQWLCLVRPDNNVYLAKIVADPESKGGAQVLTKLSKLTRPSRVTRHEKHQHGTLGAYERTIRCVTFSHDSKVVACGDLDGFVDTWSLEEMQEPVHKTKVNGKASSDSSDDDSSDDEDTPPVIEGQHWILTPSELPIPRLNSGILLLSFRPRTPASPKSLTNGVSPKKSTMSSAGNADRLIVLTAEHQLCEFDVQQGKLSDWSRRNPKTYLPQEFTVLKDRAMGGIWDVHQRLWLYGPAWMWMFDLTQDFPPPGEAGETQDVVVSSSAASNKRKREEDERMDKLNSGAGDRMHLSQSDVGLGRKMRKIVGPDESTAEWISLEKQKRPEDAGIGEEDQDGYDPSFAANDVTLARLRREQQSQTFTDDEDEDEQAHSSKPHHLTHGTAPPPPLRPSGTGQIAVAVVIHTRPNGHSNENQQTRTDDRSVKQVEPASEPKPTMERRRWWHTYKYREVLGIVPLGPVDTQDVSEDAADVPLEVAVIERPMWDVQLPGRYIRDYE